MRIERAIEAYLDWRRLERDATSRSVDSYWRILWKLAEDYPEIELRRITTDDLRKFLNRWRDEGASTRSNIVSLLHSFFDWANVEDLIDVDPSAKIRRPRKRRPDVYRPSLEELRRIRAAARGYERPAIVLMEGAGLRRSEVLGCRWADFDMVKGRLRVFRKCHHWAYLPLAPDVVREMRASMRELQPELDDFVFTVEVEQWVSQYDRVRKRKNPRCRRANRRSGGWFIAYASAQECRRFPLTSFDTASRTGSFAKAGVTLQRCGRCWVK